HRVADAEAELLADGFGPLGPEIARHRAGAALLALAPEDVGHSFLALALRPRIHAVAERAVAAALRRDRPHLGARIAGQDAGEHLEARVTESIADVRHPDRIAQ